MKIHIRLATALIVLAPFLAFQHSYSAENDLAAIKSEITKRHEEAVKRLQDWIGQVSIAAEDRGYPEGAEYMAKLARDAIRGAGKKMPVNLVMVAEGEEEIGSPHIPQLVRRPEVLDALKKCVGVFMPSAVQDLDGVVTVNLGSKGVIELELVSSGEKWGRGPAKDIHSSLKAMVDSPAWHLVKALDTLVSDDGNEI